MRTLVLDLMAIRPLWRMPEWLPGRLRDVLNVEWDVRVVGASVDSDGDGGPSSAEAAAAVRGAEVYMGYGIPGSVWEAGRGSLRWIHSAAAGVGSALRHLRGQSVLFTNSAGVHAEPMADWVLAAILHFSRGLDIAVAAQRRRTWEKDAFTKGARKFAELDELRVCIVGLGGIGRAVARRCAALGMEVRGTKRVPGSIEGVRVVVEARELARVSRGCEVLVITAPLTDETRGVIDAEVLAGLADDAIVVNVSRGAVLDEDALLREVTAGRLRAALDVFATEPLPSEHPFWASDRVLVNPHVSPVTDRFWERQAVLMTDNLTRYVCDEPLRNLVDLEAGY